jgi:hypothetical protein
MAVQLVPAGVYIAMNGRLFAWNDVRKNKKRGIFQERLTALSAAHAFRGQNRKPDRA